MATTNYELAASLQSRHPHTFNALQHLVMAMADFQKNRNKKTLFGKDKGLAAYKKFEDKLRDTLLAMVLDGVITRVATPAEYREQLTGAIGAFASVFPNWQDAYVFAAEYFVSSAKEAEDRIHEMLR